MCRPCEAQQLRINKRHRNPVPLFEPELQTSLTERIADPEIITRVMRLHYSGQEVADADIRYLTSRWHTFSNLPELLPAMVTHAQSTAAVGNEEVLSELLSRCAEPSSTLMWLPLVGCPSTAVREAVCRWLDSLPECGWFWRDDAFAFVGALQRNLLRNTNTGIHEQETSLWMEEIAQRCRENPPEMAVALYWAVQIQSLRLSGTTPSKTTEICDRTLAQLEQRLRRDDGCCHAIEEQLELFGDRGALSRMAKVTFHQPEAWDALVSTFRRFTPERPLLLPWGDQVSLLNVDGCKVWVDPDSNLGTVLLEFRTQQQQPTLFRDLDEDDDQRITDDQPYRVLYRSGVDAHHEHIVMRVAQWDTYIDGR